jgi:hypothetical protein
MAKGGLVEEEQEPQQETIDEQDKDTDTVDAKLQPGEYVVPKEAVNQVGLPTLNALAGKMPEAGGLRPYTPQASAGVPRAQPAGQAPPAAYQTLAEARAPFAKELSDPAVRNLLMASTEAEVGDQGAAAKLAYMESVINRATAEGRSLADTLHDPNYYPAATKNKLGRKFTEAEANPYNLMIDNVLKGSNTSNLGTGNESGRVRSGGAQITFNPGTGERFVAEKWTEPWRRQQAAALASAAT